MRLIDVEQINWKKGCFISSEGEPLPIIHKIATIEMLRDWQEEVNAIPIPDGVTNGDMIMAMFPNAKANVFVKEVGVKGLDTYSTFTKKWWNAPYKGGKEE